MKTAIEMILLGLVGAEGRGRTRGRLTLRFLSSQHTAAAADYLMVFTADARGSTRLRRPMVDDREWNRAFRHRSKDRRVKPDRFASARACARRSRNQRR